MSWSAKKPRVSHSAHSSFRSCFGVHIVVWASKTQSNYEFVVEQLSELEYTLQSKFVKESAISPQSEAPPFAVGRSSGNAAANAARLSSDQNGVVAANTVLALANAAVKSSREQASTGGGEVAANGVVDSATVSLTPPTSSSPPSPDTSPKREARSRIPDSNVADSYSSRSTGLRSSSRSPLRSTGLREKEVRLW